MLSKAEIFHEQNWIYFESIFPGNVSLSLQEERAMIPWSTRLVRWEKLTWALPWPIASQHTPVYMNSWWHAPCLSSSAWLADTHLLKSAWGVVPTSHGETFVLLLGEMLNVSTHACKAEQNTRQVRRATELPHLDAPCHSGRSTRKCQAVIPPPLLTTPAQGSSS
jgi:hypothetical protein